jgi:hypothetical protein
MITLGASTKRTKSIMYLALPRDAVFNLFFYDKSLITDEESSARFKVVVTSSLLLPLAVLSALDRLGVKLVRLVEWLRKHFSD